MAKNSLHALQEMGLQEMGCFSYPFWGVLAISQKKIVLFNWGVT